MKLTKKIFLFLFFLISVFTEAQELPPIENYSPNDYGAENQNWAISQSDEKYIYVANNSGLLEFNGAKWKLYPSPNNTSIRAVSVINNKIYAGYFREFGFWERNKMGNLTYHSLINQLKEPLQEDEHFWNIISYDKWVLFQSLHRIYIYNTEDQSFNVIKSKTHLPKVFKVDDSIYFQKIDEGIFKIESGKPILISNHPILQKNILVNIFSINNKILFQTQEKGFYFLNGDSILKWNIPSNNIISSVSVFSSLKLKNGNIVLGTVRNGIYQLNKNGEIISQISQKNGLSNNTILSMFEDREQNLWLGLDNGISMINFNSPFSVFNDLDGKLGSVYAAILFNNNLYIGTNQGLYFKRNNTDTFEFIEGTNGQVWCLKIYDNTLFCGHNLGTFTVDDNKATLIVNAMGTWDILPIKNKNNLLLQGHYNGLNVIEKINTKWQLRNEIEGFDISSRYFGFDSDSNIFVSHEWKGIFKLHINSDFTKILDYTTEKSIQKGPKASLITYDNQLLYASEKGIFKYNEQQKIFLKDSLLSSGLLANDDYVSGKLVANNTENTLWGFTDKNIVYFKPSKLNNDIIVTKISLPQSLRKFILGSENIIQLHDQNYLLGASKGYILLDMNKLIDKEYEITINSIEKSVLNDGKTAVLLEGTNEFKFKENNLYFTFSVPEFDTYTEVNYQYQLEGIYNEWSNWSTNSEASFKNLPYGNYTFKVKAQIGNITSKNIASYSFIIDRPGIISNEMLFLYVLLFISLLLLIHILYKGYYSKQRRKLIERKQREFTVAQLESEQKLMQIKHEQLNLEIGNKNRELTISTMSIIKKNEILHTIKKELISNTEETEANKQVIKTIDKNINDKKDWEFLEEAFNNADKDFLKKVKNLHPELTPNDLRFCAYLRLNLSSKEIAPLLNISVRSVEIKRYRLRKKMNLPHEKGLVDYILNL